MEAAPEPEPKPEPKPEPVAPEVGGDRRLEDFVVLGVMNMYKRYIHMVVYMIIDVNK